MSLTVARRYTAQGARCIDTVPDAYGLSFRITMGGAGAPLTVTAVRPLDTPTEA